MTSVQLDTIAQKGVPTQNRVQWEHTPSAQASLGLKSVCHVQLAAGVMLLLIQHLVAHLFVLPGKFQDYHSINVAQNVLRPSVCASIYYKPDIEHN